MDDSSPLLTELRDRQRRLAAALDRIDRSQRQDNAFAEVNGLMRVAVEGRDAIRLHQYHVVHDRYAPRIRWLGIGLTSAAVVALAGVVVGWIDPWLTLMVLPLLVLGGWLAVRAAGDRNRPDSGGTPPERFTAGVVGLAALALVVAAALVSGWFLLGAIPAALAAIALSTLTGPVPDLTSGEVTDA
ncbi:hypothetical protein [Pseudonocardia acaciae]|uniref:hypothetical protein n=1 Tax=Pseudonocardia acaciae TaxID=551276 RepID=UPI000490EE7C|nr:hypothetical protein [Pseudonocardia acaciae]